MPTDFRSDYDFEALHRAIDLNNDGRIEEAEFVDLLERAARSSADTSHFRAPSWLQRLEGFSIGKFKDKLTRSRMALKKQKTALEHSKNSQTLSEKVLAEHKMDHCEVIACAKELLEVEAGIVDPYERIKEVYVKILNWKMKEPDSEKRERNLLQKLKPRKVILVPNFKSTI